MSELLFVCYPRCTTCKKAEQWLKDKGIEVKVRDIKEDNPTEKELRQWHKKSGLPLKRFFNTSGVKYKELGLVGKGRNAKVLVGFKEKEWLEVFE